MQESARITWHLTLTLTLSTPWMQAYLMTIVCKFGRNPAICLGEEAICAKVYRRTDRRTDRRRTPRHCISSFLELAKNGNFRWHRSPLMPPVQRIPTNIGMHNSYILRVSALHFRRWQYGSIFIQILVMGSERQAHNVTKWIVAL